MNRAIKIKILIIIITFFVPSYFLLKGHYEQHKYDLNKIPTRKTLDYSSTLRGVFEKKKWDSLQLSESFKNKYKSKYDITKYAGRFVNYGSGSTYENGEEIIIIDYQTTPLFDFDDSKSVQYYLYFKYKTTTEGLLDDVELVKMEKRDSMTGMIIEDWYILGEIYGLHKKLSWKKTTT